MDFINNLAEYRTERKLSQRKLSKLSGISSPTICHIETGKVEKPRESTRRILAKILGYPMEEVFPTDRISISKQEYLRFIEKFLGSRGYNLKTSIVALCHDIADELFAGTFNE